MGCMECCLPAIGLVTLLWIISLLFYKIYLVIYPYFIAKPLDLLRVAGGKWAVVTGATDGIGKAYAFELARRGFNILLISRTQEKLDDVKAKIEAESKVEVKTIAFDFGETDVKDYETKIVPQLTELDVGVLVNNVGVAYDYPDVLHKVQGGLRKLATVATVDTLPVTLLSAAVLPQMVERNSGCIINIASGASYHQTAMWAVYSAAKKYVTWLTGIMQKEYANTEIIIQNVCPNMVVTKMARVKKSFTQPDADTYAKSALNTVGIQKNTSGYFAHQMQGELMSLVPFLSDLFMEGLTRNIHNKAITKKMRDYQKANQAQ